MHTTLTKPTDESCRQALVWGPLGLIGSHLTRILLEKGFVVSVLCRSRRAYPQPSWAARVRWFEMDGADSQQVLEQAVRAAPLIFNLAGSSGAVSSNADPLDSLDRNCRDQLHFLLACRRAGHRPHVVFTSSRLVYGTPQTSTVAEDHPLSPQSYYAAHKLCVEHYLHVHAGMGDITYSICRIANAYGPDAARAGSGYKILNSFIVRNLKGVPVTLFGTGEQERDFIFVDDLADALIRCGTTSAALNQVFNLGSGTRCRLVDAARIVRDLTSGPAVQFKPWPEEYLAVESGSYTSNIAKARNVLGFVPRHSMERGIAETVKFHRGEHAEALATLAASAQMQLTAGVPGII